MLGAAAESGRTILTQDLDFGRIFVDLSPAVQIVVVRSPDPRPPALIRLVEQAIKTIPFEAPENRHALFVVGPRGYRVRHRPATE